MTTLILFTIVVAILGPLLQRDLRRADERRRSRMLARRLHIQQLGASFARMGVAAFVAGSKLGSFVRAAAELELNVAKVHAVFSTKPSGDPVADLWHAQELIARNRHQLRIEHETSLARAYLGVLLDDWCRSYGWDPAKVWRGPRLFEAEQQRWREHDRLDALMYGYYAIAMMKPVAALTITDATS